jgi:hypothetical protein
MQHVTLKMSLCHFPGSGYEAYRGGMEEQIYPVAGGFHAKDLDLQVIAFGRTETEARANLQVERDRARRLDALSEERRRSA